MKLKHIAASALLAAASFGAFAGDQVVTVIADGESHNWNSVVGDGILSGNHDLITFSGLSANTTYDILISVTGQKLEFWATTNLNGELADLSQSASGKLKYVGVELIGKPSFVLDLAGAAQTGASYTGTYSVTAVPEPATYGMLLGGLGLVGAIARRKAKQAA
ncbi:PEPxxWA-CTERM sorting domain-containing protein [Duganella sp. FT135W]|uniref:PEPxxWA-CTERM sorting domain-containing protein n=1 Tax=Duganella flavida TaxID=2692175 RepID=A0A6L8KEU0_9BURK|nr:FxDxF family PEP-CTERM protein [Duganella flavida]MYM25926.1 PEPxxWA-CTERM sorting domain-containing protein [Duganella flavida]